MNEVNRVLGQYLCVGGPVDGKHLKVAPLPVQIVVVYGAAIGSGYKVYRYESEIVDGQLQYHFIGEEK